MTVRKVKRTVKSLALKAGTASKKTKSAPQAARPTARVIRTMGAFARAR